MKETTRQKCVAYGVSAAVALVIAILVALRQGLNFAEPFREICRDVSDGFFVAGAVLTSVGVLSLIATTGFFDIFAYGMRTLVSHFVPRKDPEESSKYYDYKMAREEKRRRPRNATLIVGLSCIALSALFVWLYMRA